jgi:N-acyl-D-amino-acid deacylase
VEFDILIAGGIVIDGTADARARMADVGIAGDRIVAVGSLATSTARETIDATGKVVAPGFIDVHVHSEIALLGGPHRYGSVLQGVTTHLLAPDGFGWAPLPPELARQMWDFTRPFVGEPAIELSLDWPTPESYLAIFSGNTPINVLPQVPHCAVRLEAMGWSPRPASDAELDRMKATTRAWMEAGATCLCLGLDYQPSAYADTRELIELGKVVREYDGIYAAHIRYTDLGQARAWRETMEIGQKAEIPVHISHEHVTDVTEKLLGEAAERCDLTFESYLYPAGCTHLALMLPTWAQAGGPPGIAQRLSYPATRREMRDHLRRNLLEGIERGARAVFVATGSGRYIGMSIADAAAYEGEDLGDFAIRVLDEERPHPLMVYHMPGTPEAHLNMAKRTFRHPRMMVASDGIYHGQSGHPRGFGCFARALRLARETQAVSLETAIFKMSGFPAERFRIKGRGNLAPGYAADIVIFDPDRIADRATWDEPRLEPVGIDRVVVNGDTVVRHGVPTGALPGRVLP